MFSKRSRADRRQRKHRVLVSNPPASGSDSPNMLLGWLLVAAVVQLASAQSFSLINNYEGSSFFSGFKYNISVDNTTWGNVKYARAHMMLLDFG